MRLSELIDRLEEYRDMSDDDPEVRLMTQENWPFENSVRGVCSNEEMNEFDEDGEPQEVDEKSDPVVYLVEGSQLCYGNKQAWNVVG